MINEDRAAKKNQLDGQSVSLRNAIMTSPLNDKCYAKNARVISLASFYTLLHLHKISISTFSFCFIKAELFHPVFVAGH